MTVSMRIPTVQTAAEVQLSQKRVPDGSAVMRGDVIGVLECRKAEYELRATASGVLTWTLDEGHVGPAGREVARIEVEEDE